MMERLRNRQVHDLHNALETGSDPSRSTAPLAALAAELRMAGVALPTQPPAAAGREELRLAVLAQAAERRRPGAIARVRGATFVVAGVAGAGLVVASAASGSNPAVLVVEAARELPRLAGRASPPDTVSIEGEVVGSRDSGRTLDVRMGAETFTVESPKESRDVTEAGTPVPAANIEQGATIRVTADREAGATVVTAKKIEVLQPTLAPNSSRPATPAGEPGLVADPAKATPTAVPTATPRPAVITKPSATAVTANDTWAGDVSTVSPTRTPTPRPTATPTPKPATTTAPVENDTNDVSIGAAPAADADKDR